MGFPVILFDHLKNSSFLIFSSTWRTGSRNTTLTAWVLVDPDCPAKCFLGRLLLYWSDLKSFLSWGITLAFPFPCCWSSLTRLYLSIQSMSWRTLLAGFPVKDFLKPCSADRLTLKVLMATSSKSLSISLNISQYLSEYVFRVSPSRMVIYNRESKRRGTLSYIIKRDLNARVSSLKESMEPASKPSNHLIAIGSKLDKNTLHIRSLFLECTIILWLKWLTCSTGSVQPLYMMNVDWVNRRGSLIPSILCVKGDLKIWLNTLLITSFLKPLEDELLFLRSWRVLIIRGLTMRCPWPGSITIILLIVRKEVKVRRSSPLPFVAQLSLQMINL